MTVAAIATIGIAGAVVAPRWPYSQHVLVPAVEQAFKTKVTVQQFHRYYFPHPGCIAENVSLTLPQNAAGERTVVTVQRVAITGRYLDLIFDSNHLAHVRLDGLYVRIPPSSARQPFHNPETQSEILKISIGSVTTHDSVLIFENEKGTEPLIFQIHKLRVASIAEGKPMSYAVTMGIPEPPGELESEGGFGPWKTGDVGKTALHGDVKLKDAKLDKYHGVAGTLQSEDKFSGTLEELNVEGSATVENFQLKTAKHRVALSSQFRVLVNALKGEARIDSVTAKAGQTVVQAHGSVVKNAETGRRETAADFAIQHGRAEDLLWLFDDDAKPAMFGPARCSGHVRVPKFGEGFLKTLTLRGRFEVEDGHFQKDTQAKTNELSARAQGQKVKDDTVLPDVPVQNLASDVAMHEGVANLSRLFFQVPGARARMQGNYSFLKHEVDLHGNLWTDAEVSKDTTGIKAALLKPIDPLFRRKHAGARIPVVMDGPIQKPHFGTDFAPK